MVGRKYQFFRLSEPQEWVTHVEIDGPNKLNFFHEPMWQELQTVFDDLSDDSSVRAIVFSGAKGKPFSAGIDVKTVSMPGTMFNPRPEDTQDAARFAARVRRYAKQFQECINSIERCEKPVICVLHGVAFGMAMDIATSADIRVCSEDARLSVKEVDIGIASDIGVLTRLPKVVGSYAWVKEVALTGREFGAQEALQVGLVSHVYATTSEAIREATRIAALIATKSPVATQGVKDILDWSRDNHIANALKYSAVWNAAAVNTPDVSDALRGLQSKKTPTFEKL